MHPLLGKKYFFQKNLRGGGDVGHYVLLQYASLISHQLTVLQARRRRAWTERALLHGDTPGRHPAGEEPDSPKGQAVAPHDESLRHDPEQPATTGGDQSGHGASRPTPCEHHEDGARDAAAPDVAISMAPRASQQGARLGNVAAGLRVNPGDSLRRAAIANSRAPQAAAPGRGADLPAGKARSAHPRAATASEGSEAPKGSPASACVGIAGARSKTLPAAAGSARYAVHARAVPGPPRESSQDSASGDARACSAASHAAGARAGGASCDDVEAQSGGRPFLHRLPTPFSGAAPPAGSPGRVRGQPWSADQRPQPPRPLRQPGQRRAAEGWDPGP